jgi:hypothetical protein
LWRDWLTASAVTQLGLNNRQKKALAYVRSNRRIGNIEYQRLTGTIKKTASRDLDDLVRKGVFQKIGRTGRGTHYALADKGDIKGTMGTSPERGHKGDKRDNTPSRKKRATNAPIAPAARTETSGARAHERATKGPKGPGLKRLAKGSQTPQRRTRRKPDKANKK